MPTIVILVRAYLFFALSVQDLAVTASLQEISIVILLLASFFTYWREYAERLTDRLQLWDGLGAPVYGGFYGTGSLQFVIMLISTPFLLYWNAPSVFSYANFPVLALWFTIINLVATLSLTYFAVLCGSTIMVASLVSNEETTLLSIARMSGIFYFVLLPYCIVLMHRAYLKCLGSLGVTTPKHWIVPVFTFFNLCLLYLCAGFRAACYLLGFPEMDKIVHMCVYPQFAVAVPLFCYFYVYFTDLFPDPPLPHAHAQ